MSEKGRNGGGEIPRRLKEGEQLKKTELESPALNQQAVCVGNHLRSMTKRRGKCSNTANAKEFALLVL